MPKVSKRTAEHRDHGPVEDWTQEIDGHTIDFVRFKVDIDSTPLLKGLPDDSCHCPHWGYVLEGRVTYSFPDHELVCEAGDAFYVPGGHRQRADAGTEYLEFSPSEELAEVSAVIIKNMEAMQAR